MVGTRLTECAASMTAYLAGFIAYRLSKTLKCVACVEALLESNPMNPHKLVPFRHEHGFTYPSDEMIRICKAAETAFRAAKEISETSYKLVQARALSQFIEDPIFSDKTSQHDNATDNGGINGINNHKVLLLKLVVSRYLDIKFRTDVQVGSSGSVSIRNFRQRLTIFEGL
jgi:hypothetical protein